MSSKKLKILLVAEPPERFDLLEAALANQGHEVIGRISADEGLLAAVQRLQPEMILVDLDSPGRDTLESMQAVSRDRPRPIVMFTNDGDSRTMEQAVKSGVSAYVMGGMNPERINPIMEIAMLRFREFQQLRNELEQTRVQLNERKFIEKAKGIIMSKRGLTEDAAYQALRKMAMNRNLKLSELARSVIAAAELFE